MQWPADGRVPACSRLHKWLSDQDARQSDLKYADIATALAAFAEKLHNSHRPLIWIESADVNATRSAVRLAEACEATIVSAQSPGQKIFSRAISSSGLLGCSLAAMHRAATLVIHLGREHLREMPLLAERFFSVEQEHWVIDDQPPGQRSEADSHSTTALQHATQVHWPRSTWHDRFTRILLAVRDESSAMQRPADAIDCEVAELAERLMASRYTVIVWGEDVLFEAADTLLVERLMELTQQVGLTNRCSLLPLSVDPGRETSADALLWLTNMTSPCAYRESAWQKVPGVGGNSLEEWRSQFDTILCIRNLPSDRPLPNLAFDLVIDADCNRTAVQSQPTLRVAAIGLEIAGHLQRTDHGWSGYAPASSEQQGANQLPAADALLEELRHQWLLARSPSRS